MVTRRSLGAASLYIISIVAATELSIGEEKLAPQRSSLTAGFGQQSRRTLLNPFHEQLDRRELTWSRQFTRPPTSTEAPKAATTTTTAPTVEGDPPQANVEPDPCIGTFDDSLAARVSAPERAPAAPQTESDVATERRPPEPSVDDEDEEEEEEGRTSRTWWRTSRGGGTSASKRSRVPRERSLESQHQKFEETRSSQWLLDQCAGRRSPQDREAIRSCAKWAVGIEHESMLVHRTDDGLEEYAVNIGSVLKDMALYGRAHGLDRRKHSIAVDLYHTGAEFSGRRCTGVKELNFKAMVESVSHDYKELTFDAAYCQIQTIDETLEDIISAHPNSNRMIQAVGPVARPRTGMSSELGLYTRTQGKFFTCSSCGTCDLKDYTGSYHISISLPTDPEGWILKDDSVLLDRDTCALVKDYDDEDDHHQNDYEEPTTRSFLRSATMHFTGSNNNNQNVDDPIKALNKQWIEAHQNFGNMVQWIEPVLLATFGSSDSHAVCDSGYYTEGSYRTLGSGWGVPGTTDVRTFGEYGTGRMVTKGFEWVFPDDHALVPEAYRSALSGCIAEGMGSDIRVKSKVNEHLLGANETLPPMEVGQGVEIRTFDNFPLSYLPHVYRTIALVAEAGRLHTAPQFIYDNKYWAQAMQLVMKEGWNAILPKQYVSDLAEALDLPELLEALDGNTQAFEVFQKMYETLWDVHSKGMWTGLLLDDIPESAPVFDSPNRNSWELGAINAGITPRRILEIFGVKKENDEYPSERVSMGNVELRAGRSECGEDLEDIAYLAEKYGMVKDIQLNERGSIESFLLVEEREWEKSYHTSPICKANMEIHVEDLWEDEEMW